MLYNIMNFTRQIPDGFGPIAAEGVIFLADLIDAGSSNSPVVKRRDLEKTTQRTRDDVVLGLEDAGYRTFHLDHPSELTDRLDWAKKHIVLSTFGGERHRSRTTWAPAICEIHGIPYVGLDAFGQAICHSKMAGKDVARHAGLLTPRAREYQATSQIRHVEDWTFPVIVKPSTEGSSIGIDDHCIVYDSATLSEKIAEMLREFNAPIMVEEFVKGREVSFAAIERGGVVHHSFNEIVIDGSPAYFENHVWDAEDKFNDVLPREVKSIDNELSSQDLEAIGAFLTALGPFGYIRVDGRLSEGRFHFLEATPDAWLGPGGQLAQGFMNDGWTYPQVMAAIIETALPRLPNQAATD